MNISSKYTTLRESVICKNMHDSPWVSFYFVLNMFSSIHDISSATPQVRRNSHESMCTWYTDLIIIFKKSLSIKWEKNPHGIPKMYVEYVYILWATRHIASLTLIVSQQTIHRAASFLSLELLSGLSFVGLAVDALKHLVGDVCVCGHMFSIKKNIFN